MKRRVFCFILSENIIFYQDVIPVCFSFYFRFTIEAKCFFRDEKQIEIVVKE